MTGEQWRAIRLQWRAIRQTERDLKQLKRQTMANQCTYTERDVEMYHVFGPIRKTFPAQ